MKHSKIDYFDDHRRWCVLPCRTAIGVFDPRPWIARMEASLRRADVVPGEVDEEIAKRRIARGFGLDAPGEIELVGVQSDPACMDGYLVRAVDSIDCCFREELANNPGKIIVFKVANLDYIYGTHDSMVRYLMGEFLYNVVANSDQPCMASYAT